MSKPRPLSSLQQQALANAEETLFGDVKIVPGFGRQLHGLRKRGLVDGAPPPFLSDSRRAA